MPPSPKFTCPIEALNRNVTMLGDRAYTEVKVKLLNRVQLFATPWAVAYQAPVSMGFSRQEYWSGVPFPSPGDLPTQGLNLHLLHLPALAGRFVTS